MNAHYWGVIGLCGILAMILGAIWYGPIFGKTWMRLTGMSNVDEATAKKMRKQAGPLYFLQFVLTLAELFVLSLLTGSGALSGLQSAIWIFLGFVVPVLASTCMWTGEPRKNAWTRFSIQAGYQFLSFVMFGLILGKLA